MKAAEAKKEADDERLKREKKSFHRLRRKMSEIYEEARGKAKVVQDKLGDLKEDLKNMLLSQQ